ncbi:hypothetical protein [Fodinibius sp. SL11]|uniref:hypothetical protein n=1 Tax=Fodinibius sp. SL11 TaxID=3425690 RepID=UPI003F885614
MDIEKIKAVKELKEQCKRYGVTQTAVAKECDFNVDSFLSAMQSGSISQKRINKAFKALKKLVTKKGIKYTVRKQGLDPNATKENLAKAER